MFGIYSDGIEIYELVIIFNGRLLEFTGGTNKSDPYQFYKDQFKYRIENFKINTLLTYYEVLWGTY